jgi:opacity protein-like surface antigen
MKKLLLIALVFTTVSASAQGVKLNAYTNYIFMDQVDSYYGDQSYFDGQIKGGFQWGAGLQYNISPLSGIEVTYHRQDTKATGSYRAQNGGIRKNDFDVALNWIMLNGVREIKKPGGKFEAFGGMGLGMCIIDTKNEFNGNKENATKFAWQIRGGGNVWVSEKVGIKLTAQLQSAVQSMGGGFYIGTGGAGAGVSSYSSLMQFGLGTGLVFKLGGTSASSVPARAR